MELEKAFQIDYIRLKYCSIMPEEKEIFERLPIFQYIRIGADLTPLQRSEIKNAYMEIKELKIAK